MEGVSSAFYVVLHREGRVYVVVAKTVTGMSSYCKIPRWYSLASHHIIFNYFPATAFQNVFFFLPPHQVHVYNNLKTALCVPLQAESDLSPLLISALQVKMATSYYPNKS